MGHRFDAGGDRHGARRDDAAAGFERELLELCLLLQIDGEIAELTAAGEVAGIVAQRHFRTADVVGEVLAILQDDGLFVAVGEFDMHRHRRVADDAVAAIRPGPATDAAEEVKARGGRIRGDLDFCGEVVSHRTFAAAFECDEAGAGLRFFRVHDEEGHAMHGDVAKLVQRHGLVLELLAAEDADAAVGVVGGAQVDDAEFLIAAAADEGEDVAQHFGAEGVETFGHEAASGVFTRGDVALFDFHVTALVAEVHAGLVFAGDDAYMHVAVLFGDVPGPEAGIDLAVRVNDVNEQLRRTMRAHADERRGNVLADVTEFVAHGAGGGEHGLAVRQIAGFFNFGRESGNGLVLRFRVWIELVHHRVRLLGNLLVRMRAQPRDVAGADVLRINLAVGNCCEHGERGLGPFEDDVEGLRS